MARVLPLKECPDYAPVLAYWSYNLWYRPRPIDYDTIIKAYRLRVSDGKLPLAWVAVDETMPVGMASLKEDDLWTRKDLNPWLASLYVVPEFRKRGIAEQLMRAVMDGARSLGHKKLYLFLGPEEDMDLGSYYGRRGWTYMEDSVDNDGHPTKIYYYAF